jgi:hypothetical protein
MPIRGQAALHTEGGSWSEVSRSLVVTLGCCLVAAILVVVEQASDTTPWTAYFATGVLVITTGLVGFAAFRVLGDSGDDDDDDAG